MEDHDRLKKQIEEALDQVLERMIVRRVLELISGRPRDCFIIFCSSGCRQTENVCGELALLADFQNIRLHGAAAYETDGSAILSEKIARCSLVSAEAQELADGAELLILLNPGMSEMAKLALGIRDDVLSSLVGRAIQRERPILAVPDTAQWIPSPAAYRKQAEYYLETLASYGVELAEHDSFVQKALAMLGMDAGVRVVSKTEERPDIVRLEDHIVTWEQLAAYKSGTEIRINTNAILTALAEDVAYGHGLKLVRMKERNIL